MYYKVKNSARLVGEVVSTYPAEKVTIMTIKTERKDGDRTTYSFPKAVCFDKTKAQADKIQVGDHVLVNCTIQSNKRDEKIKNQSLRTIAVNHISRVDPADERYHSVNSFRFYCRILRINRINKHFASARITFYTNRVHYITVVFKDDDEKKVDEFCSLPLNSPCVLLGSIDTKKYIRKDGTIKYTEDCTVRNFYEVKPKKNTSEIEKSAE